MSTKTIRRAKARATKRARKAAAMKKPGAKSKYGRKHEQQAKGNYRPTSPFYLTPAERARLESQITNHSKEETDGQIANK